MAETKYPKITTPIAVCIVSHVNQWGESYREGDTARPDAPAVRAAPAFWVEDGLTTEERFKVRQERVNKLYGEGAPS